ncbi:MAG: hypothetical protein F6K03_11900 [Kamptonema sp. SIO4C4]|nr:hypothetical protein [Kamptonema sp. SIO4C4]
MLQETLEQKQAENDTIGTAIALRNLALIYGKIGQPQQAKQALTESLALVESQSPTPEQQRLLAQIFEVEGQLNQATGQAETALESWKKANQFYQQVNDTLGMARAKIGQTQALKTMGMHQQANEHLDSLNQQLAEESDTLIKAQALQLLGDVKRAIGQTQDAQNALEKGLAIAQTLTHKEQVTSILISLGNTARFNVNNTTEDQEQEQAKANAFQTALNYYRQAANNAPSLELKVQAQLNELSVLAEQKDIATLQALLPTLQQQLTQLNANRTTLYAQLNFAKTLMQLEETVIPPTQLAQMLAKGVKQAQSIEDKNAEARLWVSLGQLYEKNQRYSEAKTATEKGVLLAQALNAPEIAYQGQWQLGRILRQQEQRKSAIAAYDKAVTTLQSLRNDLVAINPDFQFSFRESVEPVYRQYVDLLLQPEQPSPDNLKEARSAIEALQLAELDNFFQDACLNVQEQAIDQIDSESAIFYTIILRDRLEVIVALPGQPLRNYSTILPKAEIEETLSKMREYIADPQIH